MTAPAGRLAGAARYRSGRAARDDLEQVGQVDISRVGDRRLDPVRVGAPLRALGRHYATEVKLSTLAVDNGGSDGALDQRTVSGYLQALERLLVIEDQPAWAPHLRSRARLRKAPKLRPRRRRPGDGCDRGAARWALGCD